MSFRRPKGGGYVASMAGLSEQLPSLIGVRVWLPLGVIALIGEIVPIIGPWIAPFGPAEFVGTPNTRNLDGSWLGSDYLGQDVWSRFLHGGRSILFMATVATFIGFVLGGAVAAASEVGPAPGRLRMPVRRVRSASASATPLMI